MDQPQSQSELQASTAQYRRSDSAFAHWAAGYGVIQHDELTQFRIYRLGEKLYQAGMVNDTDTVFQTLAAADRITSAAMWLIVHMTYAKTVRFDGGDLTSTDFKSDPEGHTGGSLNMAPAYVGYLAANTLSGVTRSWLMGQGHCVAAIDAVNLLVGNTTPAHAERYDLTDTGLTRFVRDFYSYAVAADGRPASAQGSHINVNTAGGMMEGGFLGFAELQYPHMPLPGESLVTFLSDGAFEEQRGSDWIPRWWRSADCGLIVPFMIMNGRRIDQRSSMAMKGGADWLSKHLRLNGFTPFSIDGRDPASFAWGVLEMEARLEQAAAAVRKGEAEYPVPIGYGIAETVKGYGFPGAGTNRAHNLPLEGNPAVDRAARDAFNAGARKLWLARSELDESVRTLNQHTQQGRRKEKDHPLAHRHIAKPRLPEPAWQAVQADQPRSAMRDLDAYFCQLVDANPQLRVRVGNPDEMRSNRLDRTLDHLGHRVTHPEPGIAEHVQGAVITALNEEAVVNAALGNKGGLNLVATYEAFAVKMLSAVRQELIFARHQREAGRPPGWLGVPIIATSHTWENGKNEQSHQDPSFCEALFGEMQDGARVLFPADSNTAIAALRATYSAHGQIWTLVTPKRPLPVWFSPQQACTLIDRGAIRLLGSGSAAETLLLVATGGYQLLEILKASLRLRQAGREHAVIYLQEPARLRQPRDRHEASTMVTRDWLADLFPETASARVFLTHTRPEPYIGVLWPLLSDTRRTPVLGYINHGGTLDANGMLFANRSSWAHVVAAANLALGEPEHAHLSEAEYAALLGEAEPSVLFNQPAYASL